MDADPLREDWGQAPAYRAFLLRMWVESMEEEPSVADLRFQITDPRSGESIMLGSFRQLHLFLETEAGI